jgi:hypothetical protein
MRIKQISILFSFWLLTGCYVQKPLQEVTLPDASGLSQEENFANQFATLKQGDELEIILKSGEELSLRHNFISQDTLVAVQNLVKNSFPIKVPLNEIMSVEVKKIKPLASIGIFMGGILSVLFIIALIQGPNINLTW